MNKESWKHRFFHDWKMNEHEADFQESMWRLMNEYAEDVKKEQVTLRFCYETIKKRVKDRFKKGDAPKMQYTIVNNKEK